MCCPLLLSPAGDSLETTLAPNSMKMIMFYPFRSLSITQPFLKGTWTPPAFSQTSSIGTRHLKTCEMSYES